MAHRYSTKGKVDKILAGYIEAALFTEVDNDDQPLNKNYSSGDVSPETKRKMRSDIVRFVRANKKTIDEYYEHRDYKSSDGSIDEHLGHDFWLTRNGHGTGFWDRDYGGRDDIGEKLSKASNKFGSQNLYVGDDGNLYV